MFITAVCAKCKNPCPCAVQGRQKTLTSHSFSCLAYLNPHHDFNILNTYRVPGAPVAELVHHVGALNGIAWAPHSPHHICTIADDKQALIWDITAKNVLIEDPILAFSAEG